MRAKATRVLRRPTMAERIVDQAAEIVSLEDDIRRLRPSHNEMIHLFQRLDGQLQGCIGLLTQIKEDKAGRVRAETEVDLLRDELLVAHRNSQLPLPKREP